MPRVSIVIRTFNSEKTIGRVLDSIRSQGFGDHETVIVDSGSTDGTRKIIADYPHVLVDYSREEFNYGGSLNAGCATAQGEYVVCLSSHCVPLHEEWLEKLVGAMDGDARLAGAWGPIVFDVEDYRVGTDGIGVKNLEDFYRQPNQGLHNPNAIIRRGLWEERTFSEEIERCEDQDWIHHFLQRGYNTATVHGSQVLYDLPYGPIKYGKKTLRDFIVLNELFGYVPPISIRELARRSEFLLKEVLLGKRSARTSQYAVSSMVARWLAKLTIAYEKSAGTESREKLEQGAGTMMLRGRDVGDVISRVSRVAKMAAGRASGELQPVAGAAGSKNGSSPAPVGQERLFFLVGEMRSGTSWLSRTLNTHPEIFCKGEGSFFGRDQSEEEIPVYTGPTPSLYNALADCEGFQTWHSLMWNAWGQKDQHEEDARALTRLAVGHFMKKDAAASGKNIIGDKSPLHTDHVDEIHDLFPGAKVIHIYRDGRDVAVSLMHHFWRLAKDKGGIFELYPEELAKRDAYLEDPEGFVKSGESIFSETRLRQMAERWGRRVSKASRDGSYLFGDDFYELRYEELLAEPEEHLGAMFELLGAEAGEDVVRRCVEQNRFEKISGRSQGQEDSASFFRKGVAGDWENTFTEKDRQIYEEVAGETLIRMGYPVG